MMLKEVRWGLPDASVTLIPADSPSTHHIDLIFRTYAP